MIMGAGPAGGSAAYMLDKASLRVLVLKEARLPLYKPCWRGVLAALLVQLLFSFDPIIKWYNRSVSYPIGNQQGTVTMQNCLVCMVRRSKGESGLTERITA
jgi:flavin-dependent dehydrogenase